MNIFKIAGKFLDQPLLVAKFNKTVPYLLATGGAVHCAHRVKQAEPENKKDTAIKTGITLGVTIASALLAPKITNKIFNKEILKISEIKKNNSEFVDNFIKNNNIGKDTKNILEKSKNKILNLSEIKHLSTKSSKNKDLQTLFDKLIPNPENITSQDIFTEIGRLSILGFIPVIGGILGGILGDRLTDENWKEKIPNKIKEGSYQYLANIFLCNIGAGIALGIMEKCNIKSKSARALGMIGGIITTGVIGGSAIANAIGNKLINPLFGQKEQKGLYSERKPEAIDIGLHVDDIATVAVMSGLKWIEPALPIMYSISGYRAGIGYRNNLVKNCKEKKESWNRFFFFYFIYM